MYSLFFASFHSLLWMIRDETDIVSGKGTGDSKTQTPKPFYYVPELNVMYLDLEICGVEIWRQLSSKSPKIL